MEGCGDHSGFRQQLRQHEGQIEDLYAKNSDVTKTLGEIKICLERYSKTVELNFAKLNGEIAQIQATLQEIVKHQSEYDGKTDALQIKINEFDSFSWFRKPMNKLRDNFIVLIIGGGILVLAYMSSIGRDLYQEWFKR